MAEEISPLENHGWWMEQLRKDAKANRPEALRLAALIQSRYGNDINDEAAAELRRLHAVNAELLEALRPFTKATLTYNGAIIGLMREDFDRARAAIARAEGEPK